MNGNNCVVTVLKLPVHMLSKYQTHRSQIKTYIQVKQTEQKIEYLKQPGYQFFLLEWDDSKTFFVVSVFAEIVYTCFMCILHVREDVIMRIMSLFRHVCAGNLWGWRPQF